MTPLKRRATPGLAILLLITGATAHAGSLLNYRVNVGGIEREYLLARPASQPSNPVPLVLVLHGHLGTARNALGGGARPSPLSAWLAIADREGLLVAALQGVKGADGRTGWHDCRSDARDNPVTDDVAFATRVVRDLIATANADPHRIYVMGMSNGAMMSQRLAIEMQPTPAAVAAVAGTLALNSDCAAPSAPVSVLIIHGTLDPVVPFGGGPVGFGGRGHRGAVMSAPATRDFWLKVDGLSEAKPEEFTFPHRQGVESTRATRLVYGGATGPQVELLTVEGGGHVEPSLAFHYGALYEGIVGAQNHDFESAEEAWEFFAPKRRD